MTLVRISCLAIISLFLTIFCRSLAFVFAKLAANATAQGGITDIVINPWYWAELFALCGQAGFWILVLRIMPLSIAYPVTALVYALNLIWAVFLFGEEVSALHIAGYGLIIIGIVLTMPERDKVAK